MSAAPRQTDEVCIIAPPCSLIPNAAPRLFEPRERIFPRKIFQKIWHIPRKGQKFCGTITLWKEKKRASGCAPEKQSALLQRARLPQGRRQRAAQQGALKAEILILWRGKFSGVSRLRALRFYAMMKAEKCAGSGNETRRHRT